MNLRREATLPLVVGNENKQQQQVVDTVIDTGFSGFLSLPSAIIVALNLPWSAIGKPKNSMNILVPWFSAF